MKLCNVEVSGLKKVVFDRTTLYEFDGEYWHRVKSPRKGEVRIDHQYMAKSLANISKTEGYRVRIDLGTANVYSKDRSDTGKSTSNDKTADTNEQVPKYIVTVFT